MNYCTVNDLIEQYGQSAIIQLTDKTNLPAGGVDSAVAERAIADAQAEIDLYLHSRYKLPLSETPAIIKRLCCTLAFANLNPEELADKHAAHQRAAEARQTLKGIASNTLSIGLGESGETIEGGETILFAQGRNDWAYNW